MAPARADRRWRCPYGTKVYQSDQSARREREHEQGADPDQQHDFDGGPPLKALVAFIDIGDAVQRGHQCPENAAASDQPHEDGEHTDMPTRGNGGGHDRVDLDDTRWNEALQQTGKPGGDHGWVDHEGGQGRPGQHERKDGKDRVEGQRRGPLHGVAGPQITQRLAQDENDGVP